MLNQPTSASSTPHLQWASISCEHRERSVLPRRPHAYSRSRSPTCCSKSSRVLLWLDRLPAHGLLIWVCLRIDEGILVFTVKKEHLIGVNMSMEMKKGSVSEWIKVGPIEDDHEAAKLGFVARHGITDVLDYLCMRRALCSFSIVTFFGTNYACV